MKFMKLGSKPDTFYDSGDNERSVSSEIPSDFVVVVDGITFNVHKFPLLSKSIKLQRMAAAADEGGGAGGTEEEEDKESGGGGGSSSKAMAAMVLEGFPGGVETFEICAKFCYGMKVTVNAHNVVGVRCAAQHLEMTEAAEKGNLVLKVETFLNSYVFHGWKDSVIAFKSSKALLPLAAEVHVLRRCIHSIVSKALADPTTVDWSFSHTRTQTLLIRPPSSTTDPLPHVVVQRHGKQQHQMSLVAQHPHPVHASWWIEDVAELDIDFYSDVILSIKASGRIPNRILGEALEFYALKWLPAIDQIPLLQKTENNRIHHHQENDPISPLLNECQLLERIICLLPAEKGCMSCEFLLKLLRVGRFLGISEASMDELTRRVGLQLEEASLSGLLIPCSSFSNPGDTLYDVDLVQSIVSEYMMQEHSPPTSPLDLRIDTLKHKKKQRRTKSAENINFVESRRSSSATHSSKHRVAKLIDAYLAEIAMDANLDITKFLTLAKSIPSFARPMHDGLYRAIDVYLKKHPGISKSDRKKLCRLLDCKKLSSDACIHAAQNERLPLRTVVQILFFEQMRNAAAATINGGGGSCPTDPPTTTLKALMEMQEPADSHQGAAASREVDDRWEEVQQNFKQLQKDIAMMKVKLSEVVVVDKEQSCGDVESATSQPSTRTKKLLSKIWTGKSFVMEGSSPNTKSCGRC